MSENPPQRPGDKARSGQSRRPRRYQQAKQRRRAAERADSQFYRAVFSLAGIGTALVIALAIIGLNGGIGSGSSGDAGSMSNWLDPWAGPLSKLEILALTVTGALAALFVWRINQPKAK